MRALIFGDLQVSLDPRDIVDLLDPLDLQGEKNNWKIKVIKHGEGHLLHLFGAQGFSKALECQPKVL